MNEILDTKLLKYRNTKLILDTYNLKLNTIECNINKLISEKEMILVAPIYSYNLIYFGEKINNIDNKIEEKLIQHLEIMKYITLLLKEK